MTKTERKQRRQGYSRASRERRSRRGMMLAASAPLLHSPAPVPARKAVDAYKTRTSATL